MTGTLRPLAALAVLVLIVTGCSKGSNQNSTAGSKAAAHSKAVKFAECMRQNGVSDFPDPTASGEFTIDAVANGSSVDTNTAAFAQAMTACKNLEPPGFTGTTRSPQQQSAALKFAQCIRDNGVKDFPDPTSGEPLVDTNRIPSSATPDGRTILNAAMRTCRDLGAAAGVTGGK